MGFTALDGLPMGTRPGQIDVGIVLYLLGPKRLSVAEVEKLLYHESGLKGLSGISNDVRALEESSDPSAGFASIISRIASASRLAGWLRRSVESTASCSRLGSARTRRLCARESPSTSPGSGQSSIRKRTRTGP